VTNEELLAAINRRFDENDARWDQNERRWEENRRQLDEHRRQLDEHGRQLEDNRRHSDVRFESVHHEIQRLAEVVALVDEKLERFRSETTSNFEVVNDRLAILESRP